MLICQVIGMNEKTISIDASIKDTTPNFCIGVLRFDAKVMDSSVFGPMLDKIEQKVASDYTLKSLLKTEGILDARNAYNAYGKDPSRYRLAVESLYRRIIKGNKVYRINNLVDIGNYLSLATKKSTAVLDLDQIKGDICIRLGKEEPYEGISRGELNVENIPVYVDKQGPFGSTTSDTPRTMIQENTKSVLVFIISFTGPKDLTHDLHLATGLFQDYAGATNIRKTIVK